jgi:hypothetical protein
MYLWLNGKKPMVTNHKIVIRFQNLSCLLALIAVPSPVRYKFICVA